MKILKKIRIFLLQNFESCANIFEQSFGGNLETAKYPGVAQLVARLTGGQEAVSSSLATRTRKRPSHVTWSFSINFVPYEASKISSIETIDLQMRNMPAAYYGTNFISHSAQAEYFIIR